MTQHVSLDYQDPVHEGFFDAIQELLGAAAPAFRVKIKNDTTLELEAGTENDQQSIAVQGRYRWRTTATTAGLPSKLTDGEHPVFVTASDNKFAGPLADPDAETDYTFGLQIKKSGETPATELYRRIGTVTVASEKITGFEQTVGGVSGPQILSTALSGSGDITWTRDAATGAWVPQLKADAVGSAEIAAGAVGETEIAENAVKAKHIPESELGASELAPNSVGSSEIAENAVGASEIATDAVGSAEIAANAVGNSEIGEPPVCILKKTTSQGIANEGFHAITFGASDTEVRDTLGMHNPASNSSRITISVSGIYHVFGWVNLPISQTTGEFGIYVIENGNTGATGFLLADTKRGTGALADYMSVSGLCLLEAGDYIELQVIQITGAERTIKSEASRPVAMFGCVWQSD